MKTIQSLTISDTQLTVLVEYGDDSKATVSYFLNSFEVTDWGRILKAYQRLFTAMADTICEDLNLIKWSY